MPDFGSKGFNPTLAPLLLAALTPITMFHRTVLWILFVFAAALPASAQICTGALGDPIVNITFGGGNNPGPQLPASVVGGYQYVQGDCPNDGFYAIRNSTVNCFGNSWHDVTVDHTGDANGYFMLVNASTSPGIFFQDTIRGLCAGTTYEFSAWVLNVLRSSSCGTGAVQPNLTFRIEDLAGNLLRTYNSGTIAPSPSPQWRQFGLSFTTPPTVGTAILRIVNNAPGGCGNDLLLDDISFRACGPILTPSFIGTTNTTQAVCFGQAANLQLDVALSSGFSSPRFQWQQSTNGGPWTDIPGATTQAYNAVFPAGFAVGSYRYRLAVAESANWGTPTCTVASEPLSVLVVGRPANLTAANSGPACAGTNVQLSANGAVTYNWSGPGGFAASGGSVPLGAVTNAQAGTYSLQAIDSYGCAWAASTNVQVLPLPIAAVLNDTVSVCAGASITLSASGGASYAWSPADGLGDAAIAQPVATPSDTTLYEVVVTSNDGCSDTASVLVNVWPLPIANAGADRNIFIGDTLYLAGVADGGPLSASWSPAYFLASPSQLNTSAAPQQDTAYVLTVTSLLGCGQESDTMRVRVFRRIEVPNVFTPNGDGRNDRWEIEALAAYRNYTIDLFNRFGQPVLHSVNSFAGWDGTLKGKPLPVGTYYFVLSIGDTAQRLSGFVDLLR
ncbi:MAG: T9SS type B sorting domain-containing protein [Chitinophagaceae bacterium]|nr:MAG: T9SS type B sorting domain-containing protein [Chitinophagaceae bacterium]